MRLVVSDDHEGIKGAAFGELSGVEWQRCITHFMRNVLSHVPASVVSEVAEDLKAIFKVRREKTARALTEEFVSLYEERFAKAISVFEAGLEHALTYLRYPGSQHARIRSTNVLERLFKEVKRRMRVVGVFPNETSASTLATKIILRSSEEWALKRYLSTEKPNPQSSRRCLAQNSDLQQGYVNIMVVEARLVYSFFIYRAFVWKVKTWDNAQILLRQLPMYHMSAGADILARVLLTPYYSYSVYIPYLAQPQASWPVRPVTFTLSDRYAFIPFFSESNS